jgi:hypothetical protein
MLPLAMCSSIEDCHLPLAHSPAAIIAIAIAIVD